MCVGAATIKAVVCVLIYSGSGLVGNLCISIGGERRGGFVITIGKPSEEDSNEGPVSSSTSPRYS